jgi:hypothetical protein
MALRATQPHLWQQEQGASDPATDLNNSFAFYNANNDSPAKGE